MTVYFARANESGRIKIGFVADDAMEQPSPAVMLRLRQIGAALGVTIELLATAPGARSEEAAYHRRYAGLAAGHEWFRPGKQLIADIEKGPSLPPRPQSPPPPEAAPLQQLDGPEKYFAAMATALSGGLRLLRQGQLSGEDVHEYTLHMADVAWRFAFGDGEIDAAAEDEGQP